MFLWCDKLRTQIYFCFTRTSRYVVEVSSAVTGYVATVCSDWLWWTMLAEFVKHL